MIGTGYVGLVSGACFAEFGHEVVCVDIDESKIDRLNNGEIPIYEPGLEELVHRNTEIGRLSFSKNLSIAMKDCDLAFIAVGTPPRPEDGHADLSFVYQAARDIAKAAEQYTVIVDKSTVPVGTAREVMAIVKEANPNADCDVVSNPEFLREGAAIRDFMRPDRVVIGADSERAKRAMRDLYAPMLDKGIPILITGIESAEIIKYATNAFLATKVTFINEMADLCDKVGGNIDQVARGLGLDDRIGPKFLRAGPGYGGSCFPKDTLALVKTAANVGAPIRIVETVVARNDQRKRDMADRIAAAVGGSVSGLTIGILGLTFKPDTDDMRDSPAIDIVHQLNESGASLQVYDPEGMEQANSLMPDVAWKSDGYEVADGADALVLVTEWREFKELDFERVRNLMKQPVLVDLRNLYHPERMQQAGFDYYSIGRPNS